ncbi:MAG: asparagine synthase (glutamine-hydrolyzing) [Desulfobacteraceae bacterium]|nr:asparagine synthase (glutamine-hydrolyzing) [Desulfobacteraceae bacterium]
MCGIAGVYSREGRGVEKDLLRRMTETMTCRGPDDDGYYHGDSIGLGFRRLSIIDLEHGRQPMTNEDGTLVSVCNGEIYNFKELKEELRGKGHRFRTNCDVEILVHLYEEYHTGFLSRLNGQFAFAIWDSRRRTLFLARDQAGIAPLFYTRVNGRFIFASTIKAILEHPGVRREVNPVALDQLFSFPAVISPNTMFKDIFSLKAGHSITVTAEDCSISEYWDLIFPETDHASHDHPENHYIEGLEERLFKSVEYRMIADVPVGYYLSGGLDSSLIAGLVKHLYPAGRQHSFSMGFVQEDIDERSHQQLMARHVGSHHHEVLFDWFDISSRFRDMIFHAETPLKETYDTCSLALSELVRQTGFKVVLTGEGSDELFAGYYGYRLDQTRRAFGPEAGDIYNTLEEEESRKLWGDPGLVYEIKQYALKETKEAVYSAAMKAHYPDFEAARETLIDKAKINNRHPVHKRSYLDFKLRLGDHLLSDHGDRAAYANSVEARYPFLDADLMNFVATMPPRLKLNGMVEKYALKQVAEKHVPPAIIHREKFGFVAPGSPYLLKHDIEWLNDLLSHETIKRQGYFDPDVVERLKKIYSSDSFSLNLPYDNDLLMIIISFGVFLDVFGMPDFS